MKPFKASNRRQLYLMPPSIDEWLPENHLARFIAETIDSLDLCEFYKAYAGRGKEAYDPRVMLALILYGYATGTFSSRKIERATYDSVAFRYLSANTHPDHDTIATFRRRFLPQIENLFVQVLMMAKEMGVFKVGKVSLDGSKFKANASKHKALSYGYIKKIEAQLQAEVQCLLQKAEQSDNAAEEDGMNLPEEIARREERLQALKKAKEKIEARAKEAYEEKKKAYDEKMAQRAEKEKRTGKKIRGKVPKAPSETIDDKMQINLTDEESRIMKTSQGGFEQCYNAQASADHATHLILHRHLTWRSNDKLEVAPMLRWYKQHPEFHPKAGVMDAGYFSEDNVILCTQHSITPYISLGREQHNLPFEERFKPTEPPPKNADAVQRMRYRLQTPEGKAIYAQRKGVIEPIFGIIKQVMGFRQFMLRGFEKAKREWDLVCLAYNLKRLHVLMG